MEKIGVFLAVAIFFPIIFFAMLNEFGLKGFGQWQLPSAITVLCIVVPLSALAFLFYRWEEIARWYRRRADEVRKESQKVLPQLVEPVSSALTHQPTPLAPLPEYRKPEDARVEIERRLRAAITDHKFNQPPPELFERVLKIGEQLYQEAGRGSYSIPDGHQLPQAAETIIKSLTAYLSHLPHFKPQPFSKALTPTPSLIFEMIDPFRSGADRLRWVVEIFNRNVGLHTDSQKGATASIYPQRYQGPPELMAETYFAGLPLLPLLQILVPYQPFTDEMRFAHHWCLGKTGRGKTTFLTHLIKDDLDRVSKGECSLVVVDSKNLIRKMRTLKMFAPGEPLDGRATIIDSDTPFPLNPFYLPEAQARAVLVYMLANMSEASGLQTGALAFLIDAAKKHHKPSLRVIRDFFKLDARKGELPAEWSRYDKDTQDWFKHTFKNLHAATREGLHQRLANFIKEYPNLNRMFEADSFGIDIDELHKGGRVLLVDTDLGANGEDGTNLLGRLIIALMEQLSTRRNRLDEQSLKPVWFYMDEAADYIKGDHKFMQILTKARSSRVGTTVAYQYLGQIESPPVEKALENAEIHSVCTQRGTVELTIAEKPSVLSVRPLDFERLPQMKQEEYKAFRETMALAHPYKHVPPPTGDDDQPLTQKF
jgi:hypothetical protein